MVHRYYKGIVETKRFLLSVQEGDRFEEKTRFNLVEGYRNKSSGRVRWVRAAERLKWLIEDHFLNIYLKDLWKSLQYAAQG